VIVAALQQRPVVQVAAVGTAVTHHKLFVCLEPV
jgi:hypothetical protein